MLLLSSVILRDGMIPYLNGTVGTAGDENLWVEVVPLYSVHCHAVGIEGFQELA